MERALLQTVFTLCAAFVPGYCLMRLKLPGGMMLGAIAGALTYNLLSGAAYMPYAARFLAQCVAGAFIGCSLAREDLKHLPKLAKPALIMVAGMLASNVLIGFLITRLSPVDPITALLCAMPGGINEAPLYAVDMGADAGKVAVLQFVRTFTGLGVLPMYLKLGRKKGRKGETAVSTAMPSKKTPLRLTALTLAAALCGAFAGRLTGIPAGVMLGALLAVAPLKLAAGKAGLEPRLKKAAQLLSGAYIGFNMGAKDVLQLRFLILPSIALAVVYTLNFLLLSRMLTRFCGMERREACLASTPAGASEMALMATDFGVDGTNAVALHIIRLLVVVTVFPLLFPAIGGWMQI